MKQFAVLTLLLALLVVQPAWSQSMMEYGGVNGMAAGLGAGLAASIGHGATIKNTFQSAIDAQRYAAAQGKAIEQYVQLGVAYETKKQWESAERCYNYALRVIASRDGPGSPKQVPVLKHLVEINRKENNLGTAIGYQQTIVRFAAKNAEPRALVTEQLGLSNLYIESKDYYSAEPLLRESVAVSEKSASVPSEQKIAVRQSYAHVLRKLNKDDEAEAIESLETPQTQPPSERKTEMSTKPSVLPTPPPAGPAHATESAQAVPAAAGSEVSATLSAPAPQPVPTGEAAPAEPDKTAQTGPTPPEAAPAPTAAGSHPSTAAPATTSPASSASEAVPAPAAPVEPTPSTVAPDSVVAKQDAAVQVPATESAAQPTVSEPTPALVPQADVSSPAVPEPAPANK